MTLHCLECLGWIRKELADCGGRGCSLFAFNKYDKSGKTGILPKLAPLKTIRRECLTCSTNFEGVQGCKSTLCNLFPFRFGKNPGLASRTNRGSFQKRPSSPELLAKKTTQTPKPIPLPTPNHVC